MTYKIGDEVIFYGDRPDLRQGYTKGRTYIVGGEFHATMNLIYSEVYVGIFENDRGDSDVIATRFITRATNLHRILYGIS